MTRNLAELVRRNATTVGSHTALIWQDQTVTWAQLDARVDAFARGLRALAPSTEDAHPARIAIVLPNTVDAAAVYLATLRAGLVAVPINPEYTARELGQLLTSSGASALIGTASVLAAVATVRDDLPRLHSTYTPSPEPLDGARSLAELAHDGEPVTETAGDEDLAVLLYTSGSLGRPKGAMLSHRALLANHRQLAAITPPVIGPEDIALLSVPLFHAYGLNSGLGAVVYHGATGVLMEAFDPAESLRVIARAGVSAVLGVPTMFLAWSLLPGFAEAFARVRIAVCGAAPLGPATDAAFRSATGKPIFIGYGLTETAPVLTTSLASPVAKPGSIGRAIPGVDVKLISAGGDEVWSGTGDLRDDFDDDASGSPGTDPGEIIVRGENLFSGYWPDGAEGPGPDGWWATGDVAYADADGDLFLVDRLHELILVNGFNVYPREVEEVLTGHPAVVEAAVLGMPDPFAGQSVKAFVVTSAPVSVDDLRAHCRANLARFKCPSAIEFVADLPHSATGKIRKGALRSGVTTDA